MSKSFCPDWLSLDEPSIQEKYSSKNVETNYEELISKSPSYPQNSLNKFLELNGLRPMTESPEYMDWSKKYVDPYTNYWRQILNKSSPSVTHNVNINYDLYKDKFTESEYNFEYNQDNEDEDYNYEQQDIQNFVGTMEVYEEQYPNEHITSDSDDNSSDDDNGEDYYDYRHNKYYL